jgi:Putative peptidoglycan binding domain
MFNCHETATKIDHYVIITINIIRIRNIMSDQHLYGNVLPTVETGDDPTVIATPLKLSKGETLQRGNSGDKVEHLQSKLFDLGLLQDVDRYFGPRTEAAVKQLQHNVGLRADGVVGNSTLYALNKKTMPGAELMQQIEGVGSFLKKTIGIPHSMNSGDAVSPGTTPVAQADTKDRSVV